MFQRLYNYLRPQYALTWSFAVAVQRPDPQMFALHKFLSLDTPIRELPLLPGVVRHWAPILSLDDFPKAWEEIGIPFSSVVNAGVTRLAIPFNPRIHDLQMVISDDHTVLTADLIEGSLTVVGWVAALTRDPKAARAWCQEGQCLGAPLQDIPPQVPQHAFYQDSIVTQLEYVRRQRALNR